MIPECMYVNYVKGVHVLVYAFAFKTADVLLV